MEIHNYFINLNKITVYLFFIRYFPLDWVKFTAILKIILITAITIAITTTIMSKDLHYYTRGFLFFINFAISIAMMVMVVVSY